MADITEKKCALMRQTWYEAAKRRMKEGARLAFYEACFDYEFYGNLPEESLFPFDDALLMFDMVRNDLDRDMQKAENIAMRNRRNGMMGGRPKGSSKDQGKVSKTTNPKKPKNNPENPGGSVGFTTTLQNTLHNTTQQILSNRRKKRRTDIESEERFDVMFVFFYSGAVDPASETEKFYNYYAARDWQLGKGMPVKSKVALAKTWEIKDCNPGLIQARQMYSALIQLCQPVETELLTGFGALILKEDEKQIIIRCRDLRLEQILEERYLPEMQHFFIDIKKLQGWQLIYELMQ